MHLYATGNCNFGYVDGLRGYKDKPDEFLQQVLSQPKTYDYATNSYKTGPLIYKTISSGMLMFAHGSEDKQDENPYAANFKKYLEEQQLGQVIQLPPVPNPLHMNKVGIVYVWIVNHAACYAWWQKRMLPREILKETPKVLPLRGDIPLDVYLNRINAMNEDPRDGDENRY